MKLHKTTIPDLFVLEPKLFHDNRGYFYESYNQNNLKDLGLNYNFIQDNHSSSKHGVIRGLHYQSGEFAQAKLIRVLYGTIMDVAVDLREDSPTFLHHYKVELSDHNRKQMLIPRGFAHGFSVISNEAVIMYKCDNFYSPENECGIHFNDPSLGINWEVDEQDIIVSEKDNNLPNYLKQAI